MKLLIIFASSLLLSPSYNLASSKGSVVRPFSKPNSYASTISLSPAYGDSVDPSVSLLLSSDESSVVVSSDASSVVVSSFASSVVVSSFASSVVVVELVQPIEDDHPPVLSVQSYPYPYPDTYPYSEHE
jgi:hypothetical protein